MTDENRQKHYWESEHNFRDFRHPVVEFYARQRIDSLMEYIDFSTISNALDVGCGNGFSTYYIKEYVDHIAAIDRSLTMLRGHPLLATHPVVMGDAYHLPYKDNFFDLVYGWEILHHLSDPGKIISEMRRVSRRYIIVAEPNPINIAQFLFALYDKEHRWVLRFSKQYLKQLFEDNKLQIVRCFSGGWILPNKTPSFLLNILKLFPYSIPIGITNWIIGRKNE